MWSRGNPWPSEQSQLIAAQRSFGQRAAKGEPLRYSSDRPSACREAQSQSANVDELGLSLNLTRQKVKECLALSGVSPFA